MAGGAGGGGGGGLTLKEARHFELCALPAESFTRCVSFCCCITNYHEFSSLNNNPLIISLFCRSEALVGLLGFPA